MAWKNQHATSGVSSLFVPLQLAPLSLPPSIGPGDLSVAAGGGVLGLKLGGDRYRGVPGHCCCLCGVVCDVVWCAPVLPLFVRDMQRAPL